MPASPAAAAVLGRARWAGRMLATAVPLAAALLTLAGCGGGSPGAGRPGSSSSTGSATSSTPGGPAAGSSTAGTEAASAKPTLPVTTSPAGGTTAGAGTPAAGAVAAERRFWQGVQAAEAAGDPDLPALRAVADGDALAAIQRTIRAYAAKGQVLRGPITPTAPTPAGADQGGLVVKDCVDASGNLAYQRSTGALVAGQPARNRFRATFLVRGTGAASKIVNDGFDPINSC